MLLMRLLRLLLGLRIPSELLSAHPVHTHAKPMLVSCRGHEISLVLTPFINAAAQGDIRSYGLLRSLHNLIQGVGGVAFGRFADYCGAKNAMLTAHTATIVYYVLLSRASSQLTLFLSLLPCAAMHGFQATQIVACRSSSSENRAQVFGHVGFVYGSGFVAGTALVACLGNTLRPQAVMATAAGVEVLLLTALAYQMHEDVLLHCEPEDALSHDEPEAEPDEGVVSDMVDEQG